MTPKWYMFKIELKQESISCQKRKEISKFEDLYKEIYAQATVLQLKKNSSI